MHHIAPVLLNGLRSYKTEPVIWGNHNGCQHVWGETKAMLLSENRNGKGSKTLEGGSSEYREALHGHAAGESGTCSSCGCWKGELGLEPDFKMFVSHLLEIFAEVKRVVKADGSIFVNLGDSFAGSWGNYGGQNRGAGTQREIVNGSQTHQPSYDGLEQWRPPSADKQIVKAKSLMNIPHRVFIGMTDELQLIQRNNINWHKKACMPSSAKDRWTVDFESIGFFTKNARYKFNQDLEPAEAPNITHRTAINGNGSGELGNTVRFGNGDNSENRNARTTWPINYEPQSNSHYASYPTKLAEKMILASTDPGDVCLDIFSGTASTGVAAIRNQRKYLGIELQPDYVEISKQRLSEVQVRLFG